MLFNTLSMDIVFKKSVELSMKNVKNIAQLSPKRGSSQTFYLKLNNLYISL
jgi:hypothetical protein